MSSKGEVRTYSIQYANTVNSSSISNASKNLICTMAAIAENSYSLWDIEVK